MQCYRFSKRSVECCIATRPKRQHQKVKQILLPRFRKTHQRHAIDPKREAFLIEQERTFSQPTKIAQSGNIEDFVHSRLKEIAGAAGPYSEDIRVIDAGCGTGVLVQYLIEAGVRDILGVDLSQGMLDVFVQKFPPPSIEGNQPGVRVWKGDFEMLPTAMGPVDVIFFNSVFGNFYDQRTVLIKSISLLKPKGKIVASHPLGRKWQSALSKEQPEVVPHFMPSLDRWRSLIQDLPLNLIQFKDDDCYIAVLQIPENYTFEGSPIFLKGEVVPGRGLGSSKLGFATANLKPNSFQDQLKDQPKGVYFGWAQVEGSDDVHGAVFNLGFCPTIKEQTVVSLEAHVLHAFEESFVGKTLSIALVGFLRPEMKFENAQELVDNIQSDIGRAKIQLKESKILSICENSFFRS